MKTDLVVRDSDKNEKQKKKIQKSKTEKKVQK